jgi:hypothetical protein
VTTRVPFVCIFTRLLTSTHDDSCMSSTGHLIRLSDQNLVDEERRTTTGGRELSSGCEGSGNGEVQVRVGIRITATQVACIRPSTV